LPAAATAEIFSGSAAIILRPIIRALRTIAAGAIAEEEAAAIAGEAATGAVEAIKLRIPDRKRRQEASLCLMAAGVFRFILVCIGHQFGIT
jgi:hypothetical protein